MALRPKRLAGQGREGSYALHGFFHADMHQGNLFALPDGRIAAIDFGKGRIDRRARVWLAEILYGLITGNYKRVAEIHFEAGYVPPHHNVAEFATTLRAVGEPMRGLPVKDMSVGAMLDGRFNITRDFDMTQPHLLVLQKTMVMVEGVARGLDPDINLWETFAPFVSEWIRAELGPEAAIADRIITDLRTLARLPELIRNIELRSPAPGGAPCPAAPADRGRPHRRRLAVCGGGCGGSAGRRRGGLADRLALQPPPQRDWSLDFKEIAAIVCMQLETMLHSGGERRHGTGHRGQRRQLLFQPDDLGRAAVADHR